MLLKEENTKTYQKGFRDGMLNSLQHNVNLMNSQIDGLADDSSSTKSEIKVGSRVKVNCHSVHDGQEGEVIERPNEFQAKVKFNEKKCDCDEHTFDLNELDLDDTKSAPKKKFPTKAQMMWEVSREQEEDFREKLDWDIFNENDIYELFKLIRGAEYRRGKEDGIKECNQDLKNAPNHSQDGNVTEPISKDMQTIEGRPDTILEKKGCGENSGYPNFKCGEKRILLCSECKEESNHEVNSQHPRIKPDRGGGFKPQVIAGDKVDNGSPADTIPEQDVPKELYELIEGLENSIKNLKGNSTHGNCCTCQDCKNYHDECNCEMIKKLEDRAEELRKEANHWTMDDCSQDLNAPRGKNG